LRTFPIRVARGLDRVERDRADRRPAVSCRIDVGTAPPAFVRHSVGYRTYVDHDRMPAQMCDRIVVELWLSSLSDCGGGRRERHSTS
jgi:hypothetical protein